MTITKADLARKIYQKHENMTKVEATEAVEALLRVIKNSLITESDLLLSGFGKFHIRHKDPRRGRNPKTGEDMTLDARRVLTFRPSGALRSKINAG